MFEIAPGVGWLLLAYFAGTVFGLWVNFQNAVAGIIDSLVQNGYLKHRKNSDGEIEILKYDEN